ncbi:MAG: wax ester/triacylglycerol synthase family O-acyltransferase [Acidimicrobiia bacterium]|nr:wax ester/triacylglycerol synthase family O-acyltransferase [Acidimicrobiia bacterium]
MSNVHRTNEPDVTLERMGSLDAVFVAAEDRVNHMHIGSVGIFEGPVPAFPLIRAVVEAKLGLVPRYRQRVREAPLSVGRPLWIDDVHFDLDHHLRHSAVPPSEPDGLDRLVERVMSQQLDRLRPLWEMWVVEGLPDGGWAVISKVHHCMVDGIAGSDLLGVMMDRSPDQHPPIAEPWAPGPEPTRLQLARMSVTNSVGVAADVAAGAVDSFLHPFRAMGRLRDVVVGTEQLLAPLEHRSAALTGPIGPHRRWLQTTATLDDVRTIRAAFGGTVNDVVLAVVTRGFRSLLESRGVELAGQAVSSLVPVSLRSEDARGVFDNRVAALHARLPVDIEDPVETLTAVRAHVDELKRSHEVDASSTVLAAGDVVPPAAAAAIARMLVHSQEWFQTVTTNVPGPQFALYLGGRRMLAAYPFVPIAGHIRITIAIYSYCGTLYFGITGDRDHTADLGVLVDGIGTAFRELVERARVRPG